MIGKEMGAGQEAPGRSEKLFVRFLFLLCNCVAPRQSYHFICRQCEVTAGYFNCCGYCFSASYFTFGGVPVILIRFCYFIAHDRLHGNFKVIDHAIEAAMVTFALYGIRFVCMRVFTAEFSTNSHNGSG